MFLYFHHFLISHFWKNLLRLLLTPTSFVIDILRHLALNSVVKRPDFVLHVSFVSMMRQLVDFEAVKTKASLKPFCGFWIRCISCAVHLRLQLDGLGKKRDKAEKIVMFKNWVPKLEKERAV